MKSNFLLAGLITAASIFFSACKKDNIAVAGTPAGENSSTAAGTPIGNAITKIIDSKGGEIASADGTLKIIIPDGALNTALPITIQPITNMLPSGIGNAYRLTPHGEQFSKPVTIVFNYKDADLVSSIPEFLGIAYQDASGNWQGMLNTTVDKTGRQIRVTTTHFSDWTFFKSLKLEPASATVQTGDVIELKLTTTFPRLDPDDNPAGAESAPVYTSPRPLRDDQIKGWTYSGEGSLEANGSKAIYQAPDHVPAANPEAVAVNINLHRRGQFMLLSNITVLGNQGVRYLKVDEDYLSPLNKGKCALYMYGNFGADPGAGKRAVTIDGVAVEIDLWSPTILRCFINREISGAIKISSNNKVIASSALRKFKGIFLYTRYHGGNLNAGNPDALKETTKFILVYRGFGAPCPGDINQLFDLSLSLAQGSEAHFTLGGSATVIAPAPPGGCQIVTSVSLPGTSGLQPANPLSISSFSRFKGYVSETATGITIKIDYNINDVQPNVIVKRAACATSYDQPRTLGVGLEGFNMHAIELRFIGTDELSLKDTDKLKSVPLSSGILTEAWDNTIGDPTHYIKDGLVPAIFQNSY